MKVRHRLLSLLDQPGRREVLAKLISRYARWLTQDDVEIFYDDGWGHRAGGRRFPSGPTFTYGRWSLARLGRYEADMHQRSADYWFYQGPPSPGGTVIDVGAGSGEDILAFSEAVGPNGRVIAIEAHPPSFRQLEQLCRWNNLTNVRLINSAVMDHEGIVAISHGEDALANTTSRHGQGPFQVQGETLDAIAEREQITRIDLVKINIEGAEREALTGMTSVLRTAKVVCVAAHDFRADRGDGKNFRTAARVMERLRDAGFSVVLRREDPRPWVRDHIWALRSPLRQNPVAD